MLSRTFFWLIFCFCKYEGIFSPRDLKFDRHVYFHTRNKKRYCWPLFYNCFLPPEIAFFYLGIFKVRWQKRLEKGSCKAYDLDFLEKIPYSILFKVKENKEDISNTLWVIKNNKRVVHCTPLLSRQGLISAHQASNCSNIFVCQQNWA